MKASSKYMRALSYITLIMLTASRKVKFTRVLNLVERRKVFLLGGWAYVPEVERSSIVFNEYEKYLTKALEVSLRSNNPLFSDFICSFTVDRQSSPSAGRRLAPRTYTVKSLTRLFGRCAIRVGWSLRCNRCGRYHSRYD